MSENQNSGRSIWFLSKSKKEKVLDEKTNPNSVVRPFSRRGIPPIRKIFWVLAFLSSVGFGFYVRAEIYRRASRFEDFSMNYKPHEGGTLLIAGGGQLNEMVRLRFVELAGGRDARIVVIPATPTEESMIEPYREMWTGYNLQSVDVLHSDSRTQSDDPEFSKVLDDATGVWLSGGTQSWMADRYGQTLVETRLKKVLERNGVIGGTSAGAAIMSEVMIASGYDRPQLSRGFGLINTAIIDQHFVKRNRFRRLKIALQQHPDLVGFGIDEGAALQYAVGTGRFEVVGTSCVVACVATADSDNHRYNRVEFFNPSDDFDIARLRRGDEVPISHVNLEAILLGE